MKKRQAVCVKCGWVYTNPHPSAKQRRAHRKHCGATAGGGGGSGAGGGEEKNFLDEMLAEEGRRKSFGIDMERKEKRKAVCLKCGWVYANPHPSAKLRRAHRKRCGATAGGGSSGDAGGGEEKNFSDEVLAEEDLRKNSGIDMERKEKRKAVCLKCGWVYLNPHPSAKQRRAHRKYCGATAGGGSGAGGGEEKNFSDEVLAGEGRRKNSVEAAVEDLNRGVEERKVGSKEAKDFGKDAILETTNACMSTIVFFLMILKAPIQLRKTVDPKLGKGITR